MQSKLTPLRVRRKNSIVPAVRALLLGLMLLWSIAMFLIGRLSAPAPAHLQQTLAVMKLELMQQQQRLGQLSRDQVNNVNALAIRLAELQAASTRMDALGERLVQVGQLDPAEFDFNQSPPVGGPERVINDGRADVIDVNLAIDRLSKTLSQQMVRLDALQILLLDRDLENARIPAGWPVTSGWISSGFGVRNDPFSGKKTRHEGLDFAGSEGSDVLGVASGVVSWAGSKKGYGNTLEIDHGNGYVTRYAHNESLLVEAGDRVRAGQVIAKMGATGRASSPHVHFEVLFEGRPVDPSRFVKHMR